MIQKKILNEFDMHSYSDWENEALLSLKGQSISKLISKTFEDIDIQPIYFPDTTKKIGYLSCQYPGFYPYYRCRTSTGNTIKKWKIGQEFNVSSTEEYNNALRDNIKREQNCLIIDNNDIDNNFIKNPEDINKLLKDIDIRDKYLIYKLSKYPYSSLAIYLAYLKRSKYILSQLNGSLEYDPLDIILQNGTLPYTIQDSINQLIEIINYSKLSLPNYHTIVLTSKAISQSGANAIFEISYLLTKGIYYINEFISKNISIDDIIPRIKLNVYSSPNFFMDIAKIRCLRLLWSRVIKEYSSNEILDQPIIHYTTNIFNKSRLDIENNILRNTTETLSAVLSGCDIITTHSFGYPYFENDLSRRIAINTQLILKNECNFTEVIDPAGGAYFVENLTIQLAESSWKLLQEIESLGGVLEVIQNGWLQNKVNSIANKRLSNINNRIDVLVGINKYPNCNENPISRSTTSLNCYAPELKKEINDTHKNIKINDLNIENLYGLVDKGLDIDELQNLMIKKSNSQSKVPVLNKLILSEHFEELRFLAEDFKNENGFYPKCFLANIGTLSQYKARADFTTDFLRVAGIEPILSDVINSEEEAATAFLQSKINIMVICSTDDIYNRMAANLSRKVKKEKPSCYIILAGNPGDKFEEYKSAGIDDFIHIKSNVFESLSKILKIIINS